MPVPVVQFFPPFVEYAAAAVPPASLATATNFPFPYTKPDHLLTDVIKVSRQPLPSAFEYITADPASACAPSAESITQ